MITPSRKRTLSLLTNPFVLAAIPSIVLFFSIPVMHQRYRLDLKSSTQVQEGYYHSYCDLDGDGNSEKIIAFDEHNSSGITISRGNRVLNQWNVDGSFGFSGKNTLYIPADCNKDGVMEIYLFSLANDSVLLHCIPGPEAKEFVISNRLIDITGRGIRAPDPFILAAEPEDLDGDGFPELIFGISTGFSKHPRKIYAYNNVNGIGRSRAAEEPHTSTGKGMKVMNELFDLYRNYYGDIVSCEITDLHDSAGRPSGTHASLRIQYGSDKVIADIHDKNPPFR